MVCGAFDERLTGILACQRSDTALSSAVVPAASTLVALATDITVREGILDVPGEVSLYHGGKLSGVRIAWRIAGPTTAPVVCALGGISANRRVCLTDDPRQEWWSQIAGPDRPLDVNQFRILSFDYLGGSGETTAPSRAQHFPSISSYDQAEMLLRVLDHLGIKSLHAIAGGSYGGMVALAFGERHPERVGHLLIIGASDRAHPMATAWRSVQRQIVRFAVDCGRPKDGLQLARALAMSTYRSSEEFSARFNGAPVLDGERFVFPVESYLFCARRRLRLALPSRIVPVFVRVHRSASGGRGVASSYRRRPSRFARISSFRWPICAPWLRVCRSRACTSCPRSTATMHS